MAIPNSSSITASPAPAQAELPFEFIHRTPCIIHGGVCDHTQAWEDQWNAMDEAFWRRVHPKKTPQMNIFMRMEIATILQPGCPLTCTYDLQQWADHEPYRVKKMRRAFLQFLQANVLTFIPDPKREDYGEVRWNMHLDEWQQIDSECPPLLRVKFPLEVFLERLERRRPQLAMAPEWGWAELRRFILQLDDYTCQYCGRHSGVLHCDHMLPRSRGGQDIPENLITACQSCNASKHNKTPEEWLA